MTRFTFLLLLPATLFYSCNGSERTQFEHAGGKITLALDNEPSTYIPRDVTDVYAQQVLSQVMESLVSFSPEDLSVRPQLAKSWKVSADGLVYTFVLRDDVLFHSNEIFSSDDERKLTTADVKYSIEKACKPNDKGEASSAYITTFGELLKGADAYFEGKATSISGLKVNNNEVSFTLTAPDGTFVNKLAQINSAIISEKAGKANLEGEMIGTGPFTFTAGNTEAMIVLLKNEDYYLSDKQGNALPYLDSVIFKIESRKLEQLEMFERGETQIINTLPTSRISQMLEGRIKDFNSVPPKMILYNNPLLFTQFYFFNMTDPRFKDARVRQAFNYAVDRSRITQDILRGQAYENGIFGVVPPIASSFRGYDFTAVKSVGYDYNPEKARQLLAEAGYPNGTGFGSVNLRVNIGDVHSAVAEEVSNQIYQTLGINVNIDGSTFEQKNEDADYARGDIFRTAWSADYSSPETFLSNFYGRYVPATTDQPSPINQSRYVNPVFDNLLNQARAAKSQTERFRLYNKAEIELMKDPPLMVLWYAGDIQLMDARVRNLKNNAMGLLDLKEVYFKTWTKAEYLKTVQ